MTEGEPIDVLVRIEEALKSPKVDGRMLPQFNFIRKNMKNFDPEKIKVPCLARVDEEGVNLKWIMSRTGTIYGIMPPYSGIPEIVENPKVISLKASVSFPNILPGE